MRHSVTIPREVRTSMRHTKVKTTRRKRPAPLVSAKAIAPPPPEGPQELPLDLFLEDDELEAPLEETVETDAGWDSMDAHGEEVDDLMPDAPTLQDLREGESDLEDENTISGVDNPVLLYLQEAGTVPLLKPEDEVR